MSDFANVSNQADLQAELKSVKESLIAKVGELKGELGKTMKQEAETQCKATEANLDKKFNDFSEKINVINTQVTNLENAINRVDSGDLVKNSDVMKAEIKSAFDQYSLDSVKHGAPESLTFENWLKDNSSQYKSLNTALGSEGGFLTIEASIGDVVRQELIELSPIRAYADVLTLREIRGLKIPCYSNDLQVSKRNEGQKAPTTQIKSLKQKSVYPFNYTGDVEITETMLNNGVVDIQRFVNQLAAEKLADSEQDDFFNGDGVGKPEGFLSFTRNTSDDFDIYNEIQVLDSGSNTDIGTNADKILDLIGLLKESYQANAVIFSNRTSTTQMRKMKENGYIFDPTSKTGVSFCGTPVATMQRMEKVGAGAIPVAVADWKRAYLIIDQQGVRTRRTTEPNGERTVTFYTDKTSGGIVKVNEAIKLLRTQA